MPLREDGHSACIDENAVLDFVQGRLDKDEVARIDEHADGCVACRKAIDVAVRAFRERATGVDYDPPITVTRFAPDDKLAQRYRIIRFIARGGMGEVYEAEDEMLGTRIAVKTIAATIADNPQSARRLKQEVNLARRITHPNVCRIFDLGVHGVGARQPGASVLFITMELVAGVSLAHRLSEQRRFSTEAALPIVTAMAAAIGAAHRAGVIHRDFKSENVMMAPDEAGGERVVVMDFGLARNTSPETLDSTQGRGLEGTLAYMAPEQLEGQSARQPADIYALGLVMYEMLTGQLPFAPKEGGPWLPAAWKRAVEPVPPVRSIIPDIDARWNDVIARCLQREAERRPATADEVVQALTGERPGERPSQVEATPVQPAPAAPGPARRTGRWVGLAAVGAAGILTVAIAMHRRSPPPPPPFRVGGREGQAPEKIATPAGETATSLPPAPERVGAPGGATTAEVPATHPAPPAHHPAPPRPPHHDEAAPAVAVSSPDASEAPAPARPRGRSADPDDGFIFK